MGETAEILKMYLVEHGIDASDLECRDGEISVYQHHTTNMMHEARWKWKIMHISIEDTDIVCKTDITQPGTIGHGPIYIDLHEPSSLYKLLCVVQDIQDEASKRSPADELASHFMRHNLMNKFLGGVVGDDQT